jgi:hypothetical protein
MLRSFVVAIEARAMLVLKVGILLPAPPLYWWFIYDDQKDPILSEGRSQKTFRSWSAAMEDGEAALAEMLAQATAPLLFR